MMSGEAMRRRGGEDVHGGRIRQSIWYCFQQPTWRD